MGLKYLHPFPGLHFHQVINDNRIKFAKSNIHMAPTTGGKLHYLKPMVSNALSVLYAG